jgi:hypothetical protein
MSCSICLEDFEEIKESNKPVVRVPKLVSTWEAFKETQSSSTNYGNLTNTDYILQEEIKNCNSLYVFLILYLFFTFCFTQVQKVFRSLTSFYRNSLI